MSGHTPGPWHPSKTPNGRPIVKAPGMVCIADVWNPPTGSGEANARLIAASPDLLEALKEIAEYLEGCADADVEGPNREMRLFMTARAAIAKALGGAP